MLRNRPSLPVIRLSSCLVPNRFIVSIQKDAELQNVIAKPLEILFNTSLSTGIVPENFKLAKVLLIESWSISMFGRYLKKVNYIKYLGVFIDSPILEISGGSYCKKD